MSSVRRKQAEELFQVAVDLPIEKRAAFLDQRCDSDADLRSDVNDLLEAHDRDQDDFLAVSPFPPIEELLDMDDSVEPETEDEGTPQTLSGHYHIERELGHGGMGVVYLAHDTKLDRDVAIKMLPAGYSHDPARLTLFEREARTAGNLNHPNIGTIYEFGAHEGRHFIAMEYVEGDQLGALLQGGMPLALREFIDIAIEIAQGLTAAHDSGVVHRDLKPGNVMRTGDGRVKILDFGLAKAVQEGLPAPADLSDSKLTPEVTSALGTAGYSSPEQCRGEPADFRSDLFSFGVVLYELITGRPPFKRDSFPMTIQAVLKDEPEPPNAGLADVPPRLANLITKLLSKRPEDRCQSSAEVLTELKGIKYHLRHPYLHLRAPLVIVVCLSVLGLLLYSFWPEAARLEEDEAYVAFQTHVTERKLGQALADLARLEERWDPTELAGLRGLLTFYRKLDEDIPEARQRLGELDRDWRSGNRLLLVSARGALDTETQARLKDDRNRLPALLAGGLFDVALPIRERIEELDPEDRKSQALWDEAKELKQKTENRRTSGEAVLRSAEKLSAQEITTVRAIITELSKLKLGEQRFRPADDAASRLRLALVQRLADPSFHRELTPAETEVWIVHLSTLDPENPAIDALEGRKRVLGKEADLKELRAEAENLRSFATKLHSILSQMEILDRAHEDPATQAVEKLYEQRELQVSSYNDAVSAFSAGGTPRLEKHIQRFRDSGEEKYRVDGLEVMTGLAFEELEQLEAAQDWFTDYKSALAHLSDDLSEVRRLQLVLDDSLPERFVLPAEKHLEDLRERLAVAEKNQKVADLRLRIDHAVRLLHEDEARRALDELVEFDVDSVQIGTRERVKRLLERKQKWEQAEDDYDEYRLALKTKGSGAEADLALLELDWRDERKLTADAIQYEANLDERKLSISERQRLHLRQALLDLRLGDFEAVQGEERELLRTTSEGLTILAQAKFATASDAKDIRSALAELEQSLKMDPSREHVAHAYLKGAFLHELFIFDPGDTRLRDSAARALTEAIENPGFDSADAYFRLASIHLKSQPDKAIDYAEAAWKAGISEEEIVVRLGGNAKAVSEVDTFLFNVRFAKANGYYRADRWQECVDAFTQLIKLKNDFPPSFAYRGDARRELQQKVEALDDFKAFLQLVPTAKDDLWDLRDTVFEWSRELQEELK